MVIKPFYQPSKFCQIFGSVDLEHPDTYIVHLQRSMADAWDSAIDHVLLNKPIQQPVLTHPVVPDGTHHQPKGD